MSVFGPARRAERIEVAPSPALRPGDSGASATVRRCSGRGWRRDLAVLQRGQERERRLRPPDDLIEDRRRVALRECGDEHGVDVAAGILGQRRDQLRFEGVGCSGSTRVGPIAANAPARGSGTARRLAASSARRSSLVPGAKLLAATGRDVRCWRQARRPCPIRHDWQCRRRCRRVVEQLLQRRRGRRVHRDRAAFHPCDGADGRSLERCRGRSGSGGGIEDRLALAGSAEGATAATNSARPSAFGEANALAT